MELRCPHCGERIIARGFGKCPACQRDLPDELKLSSKEIEFERLDEEQRRKEKLLGASEGGGVGIGVSI